MAPKFQVSPGSFTYTQTIPSNFGEAYAKGIESAGKSLAGAVSQVGGMLEQNQTTNDLLTQFSQMKGPDGNPIISQEDYENIMKKGLGARHEMLGQVLTNFHSQYQNMLEQKRQIAVAQATAAAQAPYRMGEIAATGAQQRQTQAEEAEQKRKLLLQQPENRPVVIQQPSNTAAGADKIQSPLSITLNAGKQPQNPNLPQKLF
jgi:hypothetical protein